MEYEVLETEHGDVVQDLCYDFYGQRIATCSTDRVVKVWSTDPGTGTWRCDAQWQAHDASVMRVRWAHPEFSAALLVTCALDCKAKIWEERADGNRREWTKMAELRESRSELNDVDFAPPHMGLRLATASNDGLVRVYASVDPSDLSLWTLMEQFYAAGVTPKPVPVRSVSWNPSPRDAPGLVAATDDGSSRVWLHETDSRSWRLALLLTGHKGAVLDVSWSPNPGRKYHLIATVGEDGRVLIFKVELNPAIPGKGEAPPNQEALEVLAEHKGAVWRAEWNVAGTALATSGEDGTRLWQRRAHHSSRWHCVGQLDPATG